MQPRTCSLTAFALTAAVAFGAAAMAADLPKEGTFSGKPAGYGTFRAVAIGKERLLIVIDDNSLMLTNGFADHTAWNCFGLGDYTRGVGQDHGYCVGNDPDGDKLVMNWVDEKHTLGQKAFSGSFTWTTGTGKFAGISGGGSYVEHGNEFLAPGEGSYMTYWPVQGNYELP